MSLKEKIQQTYGQECAKGMSLIGGWQDFLLRREMGCKNYDASGILSVIEKVVNGEP